MPLLKTRLGLSEIVQAPHVQSAQGPVCMTCGRLVDSEKLVEGEPANHAKAEPASTQYPKVLVRHHGAEELRTFDMGSTNWDGYDLSSYMRRTNWFDPRSFEGVGMGEKIIPRDAWEDPPTTKAISIGAVEPDPPKPLIILASER